MILAVPISPNQIYQSMRQLDFVGRDLIQIDKLFFAVNSSINNANHGNVSLLTFFFWVT